MPKVSADPYDVLVDDDHDFVEHVLKPVAALSMDYEDGEPSRWLDLGEGWLCMNDIKRVSGGSARPRWEGSMQRINNKNLPGRASPRGRRELDIDDDEGLDRFIGFLYDEGAKLLWLQRDRAVCGKLLFMDYLNTKSGTAVWAAIRLRKDAIARAKKLKVIRSVDFAYLDEDTDGSKGPLEKKLDKFLKYGAGRIDVRISSERKGTLTPDAKELVREVVEELHNEHIAKAQIKGRYEEDDEKDTVIDLLRDRAKLAISVAEDRRQDPVRLVGAVRDIWLEFRDKV